MNCFIKSIIIFINLNIIISYQLTNYQSNILNKKQNLCISYHKDSRTIHSNHYNLNTNIHSKFQLNDLNKQQSADDFKINSQIARLNAVAAKLRAEAAELEV